MDLEVWQKRTGVADIVLSLAYTTAYVVPIYFYSTPAYLKDILRTITYLIWAFFVIDYVFQLWLSKGRSQYFRTHLLELVTVLLPFFRAARALRALLFAGRATLRSASNLIKSIPIVLGITGALLVIIMGAAVLEVERFVPGANIINGPTAIWWAFTTVTTIGYGDVYPITNEGRLITAILILFGVGMVSTLTATFAAWILSLAKNESTTN